MPKLSTDNSPAIEAKLDIKTASLLAEDRRCDPEDIDDTEYIDLKLLTSLVFGHILNWPNHADSRIVDDYIKLFIPFNGRLNCCINRRSVSNIQRQLQDQVAIWQMSERCRISGCCNQARSSASQRSRKCFAKARRTARHKPHLVRIAPGRMATFM